MGLDMYLMKQKKVAGATAQEIKNFTQYCEWKNPQMRKEEKISLKDWCGIAHTDLPNAKIRRKLWALYREGELDSSDIGYWRKANAIHGWFVENVQNGEDDCRAYPVGQDQIEELLGLCKTVLNNSKLVAGKILTYYSYENNEAIPHYEEGLVIENPEVAEELLPTCAGFFFGSEEYDECYLEDVKETIEILTAALEETDFEKEVVLYQASW